MAFQAMNHGLEGHATSPPRIKAIHKSRTEEVLAGTGFRGANCVSGFAQAKVTG